MIRDNASTAQDQVFSPLRLGALVLLTITLASLLIPDDQELVRRLDMDGEIERLHQMAAERMNLHRQQQQQPDSPPVPQTEAALFTEWLQGKEPTLRTDPAILAEQKHILATTTQPAPLIIALQQHGSELEPALYETLADTLARRSLGLGQPELAGNLLSAWCQQHPSWPLALRAVQAWRWAVRSDQALRTLDACSAALPSISQPPPEVHELRITLALESNQPNRAYDLLYQQYQQAPENQRSSMLSRLVDIAGTGDRTTEATLLIQRHLSTIPFHTAPLHTAIQMARKGQAFPTPTETQQYISYATALAHWLEWSGHGEQSFDPWLRLSILDQTEAWSRVSELYVDLLRDQDYIQVLADRINHGQDKDKQALLAQLQAEQGLATQAAQTYLTALKDTRQPAQQLILLRGLARLYQEHSEWQHSISTWTQILTLQRDDLEALRSRAYSHVRLGHYPQAKADLLWLSEHSPTDATLHEECADLCDSLGDERSAAYAIQRMLSVPGRHSLPEEHVELASRFQSLGLSQEQLSALRDGLVDHPDSIRIRYFLAESLAAQTQHDEAVRTLSHPTLRQHGLAMSLLIDEAMQATNRHIALRFLAGTVPPPLHTDPSAQYRLAILLEQSGDSPHAQQILTTLQDPQTYGQSNTWHDLASLCLESGDLPRAELFEKLHLAHSGQNQSKAWELLGDIYQAQERQEDAQAAYRQAISVLTHSTAPG